MSMETEIEFSVLSRQCLSRRIPDQEILKCEVQASQNRRNQQLATVKWHLQNKSHHKGEMHEADCRR